MIKLVKTIPAVIRAHDGSCSDGRAFICTDGSITATGDDVAECIGTELLEGWCIEGECREYQEPGAAWSFYIAQ